MDTDDGIIDLEPQLVGGQEVFAEPVERASLDEVRQIMLAGQAAAVGALPVLAPTKEVVVDSDGQIVLVENGETGDRRDLSVISDDTFASDRPSLDAIRDQVLGAQRAGTVRPSAPPEKLVVDPTGAIGFESDLDDGRPLSEITQETFATSPVASEQLVVSAYLPSGTRQVEVDGSKGWLYEFDNEFGEHFAMWAFFDGFLYQVALISPAAESVHLQHDQHLFRDGYLCLTREGGARDLQTAWSRSVLWSNGYSAFKRTGVFPFSINNQYPL